MSNKFKTALASDTSKSILSAVICALLGILIGFIILLIINAEHAPKAISVILKNWMYYRNNGKKLYYLGQTLVKAVPLILCGIAVLFAYKSGLFNIGVAGQYCIGIGISLWTALAWHLPWGRSASIPAVPATPTGMMNCSSSSSRAWRKPPKASAIIWAIR